MLGQGLFPSSHLELCKMGRPGVSCRGKASQGEGVGMGSALGVDVETRGQLRSWEKRDSLGGWVVCINILAARMWT